MTYRDTSDEARQCARESMWRVCHAIDTRHRSGPRTKFLTTGGRPTDFRGEFQEWPKVEESNE